MTNFNSTNVALTVAGGSGDNLISSGNVRTFEQVWLDSFTYTSVITTADTICIGIVPANRNIVGVEVMLPSTFAPTNTTINVGVSGSTAILISSSTAYIIGNLAATGSTLVLSNRVVMNNLAGFPYATTTGTVVVSGGVLTNSLTKVYLSLGVIAMSTPTAGTITTIIRYV